MARLPELFKRCYDLGIDSVMPAFEAKHVRLCNVAALLSMAAALVFFLLEIPLVTDWGETTRGELLIILARGLSVLPYALPLWLNSCERYAEARVSLVAWTCLIILEMCWIFGGLAPSHLFLIVLGFLLFVLFPPREKRLLLGAVAMTVLTFSAFIVMQTWHEPLVPVRRPEVLFLMQVVIGFGCLFLAMLGGKVVRDTTQRAERMALYERERADRLLLNILPESVANRLKDEPGTIADGFREVTVLFADIVDFTPMSAGLSPEETVYMMDGVFSRFDDLVEKRGLEKIKTIGDAYMLAGGLPDPSPGHVREVVEIALDMMEEVAGMRNPAGGVIELRIGIATGPVVAGVIGRKKFLYDLWGDTVNTASRLESTGLPGRVHVGDETKRLVEDAFCWEDRGVISIKGKGEVRTWFVMERKES